MEKSEDRLLSSSLNSHSIGQTPSSLATGETSEHDTKELNNVTSSIQFDGNENLDFNQPMYQEQENLNAHQYVSESDLVEQSESSVVKVDQNPPGIAQSEENKIINSNLEFQNVITIQPEENECYTSEFHQNQSENEHMTDTCAHTIIQPVIMKSAVAITIKKREDQSYPCENYSSHVELPQIKQEDVKPEPSYNPESCDNTKTISHSSQFNSPSKNLCVVHMESPNVKVERSECLLCDQSFETRASVMDYIHQSSYYHTELHNLWCVECSGGFPSIYDAMMHAFRKHKGCTVARKSRLVKYICPFCHMKITVKRKFYAHLEEHRHQDPSSWQEQKCKVISDSYNENSKSTVEMERYICPNCIPKANPKRFREKLPELKKEQPQVLGVLEIGECTCPRCFREFDFKHQRDLHIRKHKQKKLKAICSLCGWTYDNFRSLKSHIKCKHPESSENKPKPAGERIEKFICPYCLKHFRFEYLLRVHEKSCVKKEGNSSGSKQLNFNDVKVKYRCSYRKCAFMTLSYHGLRQHSIMLHSKPVKCARCQIKLGSKGQYDKHISQCNRAFKCTDCCLKFESRKESDDHLCPKSPSVNTAEVKIEGHINVNESSSNNGMSIAKCAACEENFQCRKSVEDYITEQDEFHCQDCFKKFGNKCEALCHAYFEHSGVSVTLEGKAKYYKCFLCSRLIWKKNQLEEHIKEHNKLGYKCESEICGWMFENIEELEEHMRLYPNSHHQSKGRELPYSHKVRKEAVICAKCLHSTVLVPQVPCWMKSFKYKCRQCVKHFGTKWAHYRHMHSVHGVVDKRERHIYWCRKCGREFCLQRRLQAHLKSHHNMKCKCAQCGWEFESVGALDSHLRCVHNDNVYKNSELELYANMRHACSVCKCAFANMKSLVDHILISGHEQMYMRSETTQKSKIRLKLQKANGEWTCDRVQWETDSEAQNMENNMPSNDTVYECLYCGWDYYSVSSLNSHVKSVHSELLGQDTNKCEQPKITNEFSVNKNQQIGKRFLPRIINVCSLNTNHDLLKIDDVFTLNKSKIQGCERCWFCKRSFPNTEELKLHTIQKHGRRIPDKTEGSKICWLCQRSFATRAELQLHKIGKHECRNKDKTEGFKMCWMCTRSFASAEELKSHIICEHEREILDKDETQGYKRCWLCKHSFGSTKELESHIIGKHVPEWKMSDGEKTESFTRCSCCELSFSSDEELKSHMICEHERKIPEKDKTRCWLCKRSFLSDKELKMHLINKHDFKSPDSDKTPGSERCSSCRLSFASAQELKAHIICKHEWRNAHWNPINPMHKFSAFKSRQRLKKLKRAKRTLTEYIARNSGLQVGIGLRQRPVRSAKLRKVKVVLERIPGDILKKYVFKREPVVLVERLEKVLEQSTWEQLSTGGFAYLGSGVYWVPFM